MRCKTKQEEDSRSAISEVFRVDLRVRRITLR
jgi:hypothetical protein